jgi:hemerythrin
MVTWSNAYATGVQSIDEQHQMLFRLTNDFHAALETDGEAMYEKMLTSLESYARAHFRLEEECMVRYRCPVADQNRRAHDRFTQILADMRERYTIIGFDRKDAQELIGLLEEWLVNHISRIDVQLKVATGR